jgi:hypothetical protein
MHMHGNPKAPLKISPKAPLTAMQISLVSYDDLPASDT